MSLFIWATALFGIGSVLATPSYSAGGVQTGSIANLTDGPNSRSNTIRTTEYKKYENRTTTKTYNVKQNKDLYYVSPSRRGASYGCSDENGCDSVKSVRADTFRKNESRKYNLAHPFYQPTKLGFVSVTDFSSNINTYKFDVSSWDGAWDAQAGKWNGNVFSIKEDISFGISDQVAFVGSLRYSDSDYEFNWDDPAVATDKESDNGIDIWGLGLQWKFVDNSEWIAYVGGYYQAGDFSHSLVFDTKAGYKVGNSTIYGLARLFSMNYDTNSYGNGVDNGVQSVYLAMESNDSSFLYFEGGAGLFTALDKDWSLNLEGVIGQYSWHTNGSIKAAIGWQPTKSFGLNLYGKTTLFDTADSDNLPVYTWTPTTSPVYMGTANLSGYRDTMFGLQVMLAF